MDHDSERGAPHDASPAELTDEEKRTLLDLAKRSVENAVLGRRPPRADPSELTPHLRSHADCFVTLYEHGALRGCIGSRSGRLPIHEAVVESAASSAVHDFRFSPIVAAELPDVRIGISVMTPTRRLEFDGVDDLRRKLKPGIHGVTIRRGGMRAIYLPQVWEHFAEADDPLAAFLTSLSRKAGDTSGTMWLQPDTVYEVFETLSFGEDER